MKSKREITDLKKISNKERPSGNEQNTKDKLKGFSRTKRMENILKIKKKGDIKEKKKIHKQKKEERKYFRDEVNTSESSPTTKEENPQ